MTCSLLGSSREILPPGATGRIRGIFAGRLLSLFSGSMLSYMIDVGHRTGLFAAAAKRLTIELLQ